MLNRAIIMGRLTRDPELRQTASNIPVASFTLAVDRSFAKQGEDRQTDFIDIVAWRQTAEFVSKWFAKGQLAAVDGRIQVRSYTDKDGNTRKAFEIVADSVHFAESRKKDGAAGALPPGAPPALAAPAGFVPDFGTDDDGELPF